MLLNEYQRQTSNTAVFPADKAMEYCTIALCGEAGEFANEVKKVIRGDRTLLQARDNLLSELGDTLWYVAQAAETLGFTLEDVAKMNLGKLAARYKAANAQN